MFKQLLTLLALSPALLLGAVEETLAIIKPDAVQAKHVGDVIQRYEEEGFKIKQLKLTQLTPEQAQTFYKEHDGKPFYNDLTQYMTSGPVVVLVVEKENAVADSRKLIGSTNPKEAEPTTLRGLFGESKSRNAVHGSDSKESAQREIGFFFD